MYVGGGGCDDKEWDLNWEHPLPRVLEYKRTSDMEDVDATVFRA